MDKDKRSGGMEIEGRSGWRALIGIYFSRAWRYSWPGHRYSRAKAILWPGLGFRDILWPGFLGLGYFMATAKGILWLRQSWHSPRIQVFWDP